MTPECGYNEALGWIPLDPGTEEEAEEAIQGARLENTVVDEPAVGATPHPPPRSASTLLQEYMRRATEETLRRYQDQFRGPMIYPRREDPWNEPRVVREPSRMPGHEELWDNSTPFGGDRNDVLCDRCGRRFGVHHFGTNQCQNAFGGYMSTTFGRRVR